MDPVLSARVVRACHRLTLVLAEDQPRAGAAAVVPRTWRRCLLFIDDTPGITPSRLAPDLALTPAARNIVASLRAQIDAQVDDLFSPLSAAESRQLIDLLDRSLRLDDGGN